MRRIRTLAGAGKLRTGDRDLGAVSYELVVWREPRGWTVADGSLRAEGPGIVSAFHSNTQVLLDLETGERILIEVTQASMARGQFVVSGPMPRNRPKSRGARTEPLAAARVKAAATHAALGAKPAPAEAL